VTRLVCECCWFVIQSRLCTKHIWSMKSFSNPLCVSTFNNMVEKNHRALQVLHNHKATEGKIQDPCWQAMLLFLTKQWKTLKMASGTVVETVRSVSLQEGSAQEQASPKAIIVRQSWTHNYSAPWMLSGTMACTSELWKDGSIKYRTLYIELKLVASNVLPFSDQRCINNQPVTL